MSDKKEIDYSEFDLAKLKDGDVANIKIDSNFLTYELVSEDFEGVTFNQAVKFLKGKYNHISNLKSEVTDKLRNIEIFGKKGTEHLNRIADKLDEAYPIAEPFTYKEAFELENETFRGGVFTTIDVVEMINNLPKKMIKTDGIEVSRKTFDSDGNRLDDVKYHNIYETYEINGESITLGEDSDSIMYAVRCWCTSTNEEHWIWIEEEYSDEPLTAIASTFRIHENVIPKIKELKRQGDIMLVEMLEEVEPKGDVRPLTKEEYFNLLTVET